MAAFGLVVLLMSIWARCRGGSARSTVTRYLAWLLILPPIILPLVCSRTLFQVVILLVSLQCVREFLRATGLCEDRSLAWLSYGLTATVYVPVLLGLEGLHQIAPLPAVGMLLLVPVVRGQYDRMLRKVCLAMLAVLYFGWFLSHLAALRSAERGAQLVFFLLVLTECNDALGYLWGGWLGQHRLSPRISPNKTVEGAVLAGLSVLVLASVLGPYLLRMRLAVVLTLAGLVIVLGVCGDLVLSFIKRDLRIKDMGAALPGHGGVLDRCDSLILVAPMFFHLARVLGGD